MDLDNGLEIADDALFEQAGRRLSEVERAVLQGCWLEQTYEEVAHTTGYSISYLNRTVAPKLWQSLSYALGEKVNKKNVRFCLERRWRKQLTQPDKEVIREVSSVALSSPSLALSPLSPASAPPPNSLPHQTHSIYSPTTDWGEAIDVSVFYGRQAELSTLSQWILNDRCRMVAILGMGGMGKTALSVKLTQELIQHPQFKAQNFQFVIWRSLRNAPPLEELLTDLTEIFVSQQSAQPPKTLERQVAYLLDCLRRTRCLLVLDNVESILQGSGMAGKCRPGYEPYSELFRNIGEVAHQSCVLLTSREKPDVIAMLEGDTLAVRTLSLTGLAIQEAVDLLEAKGLTGELLNEQSLVQRYSGNPLALKIIATSIRDLFDGNVDQFLAEGAMVFNGIRMLLEQQFSRLSNLEQQVMYWLAINREWTPLSELQTDLVPTITKTRLLEVLESLGRRSLLEVQSGQFTLQPVVMEYITEQLIEQVCAEITSESPELLLTHALLKAQAKDYVRESQLRVIMRPLVEQLRTQLPSQVALEKAIQHVLTHLRHQIQRSYKVPVGEETDKFETPAVNYGAGNLLNLCSYLSIDLAGYDFSQLAIAQAYLQNTPLHYVNFAAAHFHQTVWAQGLTQPLSTTVHPDSCLVAVGCQDGTVFLWDAKTHQQWLSLPAHQSWVFGVAFSPDGTLLATASFDRTVKLWRVQTGELVKVLSGHEDGVIAVAFNAQGNVLVSGGDCGTVKIWNLETLTCRHTLHWYNGWVKAIAIHPNGQHLATGSEDGTLRLWDLSTGECLQCIDAGSSRFWTVAFHPDGYLLASGDTNHQVKLWDLATGNCIRTMTGHTGAIWDVDFSPDGQLLASSGDDGPIRLWNGETGQCVRILQEHRMGVWAIAFCPSGQALVSVSSNELALRFWSLADGHCLRLVQGKLYGHFRMTINPQGTLLASGGHNHQLKLWDMSTGKCLKTLDGHTNDLWGVAFHPQLPLLASAGLDSTIRIWDITTGACRHLLEGHAHWVLALGTHPQGQWLVTGGSDQQVKLWDWQTGACLQIFSGHTGFIESLVVHPKGQFIASAGDDQTIRLWQPETRECLGIWTGHSGRIWSMAIAPDGKRLASCGDDQTVRLWDTHTGECIHTLMGHGTSVFAVAFSPDGQHLATGGGDRTIRLWDAATGTCLRTFALGDSMIAALQFCPTLPGTPLCIVSGSFNQSAQIWNLETGECQTTFRSDRPYEGMNIMGVTGITPAQKQALKALGAID